MATIIEKSRAKVKKTGSGLEGRFGFGNSTISKWSKSSPTLEKAVAVADFFGVTVDELLREMEVEKK